jgi:hypothetical protein
MNPVVHFEMPYDDQARVARFYQAAFGWQTQALGAQMGNYVTAATHDLPAGTAGQVGMINGGFFPRKPDWPAQYPSVVIAVEDIRAAMKQVAAAGGEVLGEPVEIPGIGHYVSFMDTEHNRVGILQPFPRTAPGGA